MLRILQCFTASVRLSGSGLSDEGRLEVYYHGVWGTVCDRLFDNTDAQVACNALLGFGYVVEFCLLAKYCHSIRTLQTSATSCDKYSQL